MSVSAIRTRFCRSFWRKPTVFLAQKRGFFTTKTELPPLVSCEWLSSQLERKNVKIVDGSWHMGNARNGAKEFSAQRIPGATFFDLNEICDKTSKYPRMMPSTQDFEVHMSELGLTKDDIIIVYDSEMFSSPRVWFMLKAFGAKNVSILNGGFKKWQELELPIETGVLTGGYRNENQAFNAKLHKLSIVNINEIKKIVMGFSSGISSVENTFIVDARAYNRWAGIEDDPYKNTLGTRAGHIPGSKNIPYKDFLKTDSGHTEWHDYKHLKRIFEYHDIEVVNKDTVISTCGSGVTACFINFAIHLIQWNEFGDELDYRPPLRLYDGSWAEWGSQKDTPVHTVDQSKDTGKSKHGFKISS